jgi:4-hydroxy-tetrahydrodipicolinate reductase
MVKIAVAGAQGRMGQSISQLVEEDPETELVAKLIRPKNDYLIEDNLASLSLQCEILIDFTNPAATLEHLTFCCQRKVGMVIGVTGFTAEQKDLILTAAKQIPIVFSPNMSIGVNLSFKLLAMAAQVLNQRTLNDSVGVAIQEVHHKYKKDAPSGTALKMGEIIADTWGQPLEEAAISFSAARLGEVMGDHSVLFALDGEQIEIKHKTESRIIFARGAVLAAKWLSHQSPGLYDMQDVLGLKDSVKT